MTLFNSRVIRIVSASILGGILIGVVGGAFRYLLITADFLRGDLIAWAHGRPRIGWLLPVVMGAAGAWLARLLVIKLAPYAEGSGVQRVEAVFAGEVKPASFSVVPVKFFGGLLAMGSGLALGREGPTVQMGASFGTLFSRFLLTAEEDRRVVDAASAGAGLAVAFNAPIGGSIFVFEELTSNFTPWLLIATLSACTVAVWLMRGMLGNVLDFTVPQVSPTENWTKWPFLLLGALLGVAGAIYNAVIMGLLRVSERMRSLSSLQRAALIGAAVGVVAWFVPSLVGGGDTLTQSILSNQFTVETLTTIFLVRFALGPWSYAAGEPGGLFAPLLLLGASSGALFAGVLNHFMPNQGVSAVACAIIGMGALFSATVRAPLTGIVLAVEMTGRADLTLGLLGASLVAMVVAMLLKSEPIYESLKRRMLSQPTVSPRRVDAGAARPG
ncbi:MAG: ClC family H(+)/Cl(-) exchange transporter [Candidatus Korobacteraceae bacterium]